MIFHQRIFRILAGITGIGFSLVIAAFLVGLLAVILNFSGNASFPVDCAVVFGSAVHGGTKAGPGITRRMETAVNLWKEGSVDRLFLTGGTGEGNAFSEARVMRNVALKMGVDPSALVLEEGATSTWQNIAFVKPLLVDCDSTVGVSDRYHLARIWFGAWLQGVPMSVYPSTVAADPVFEGIAVLREAAGMVLYGVGVR